MAIWEFPGVLSGPLVCSLSKSSMWAAGHPAAVRGLKDGVEMVCAPLQSWGLGSKTVDKVGKRRLVWNLYSSKIGSFRRWSLEKRENWHSSFVDQINNADLLKIPGAWLSQIAPEAKRKPGLCLLGTVPPTLRGLRRLGNCTGGLILPCENENTIPDCILHLYLTLVLLYFIYLLILIIKFIYLLIYLIVSYTCFKLVKKKQQEEEEFSILKRFLKMELKRQWNRLLPVGFC